MKGIVLGLIFTLMSTFAQAQWTCTVLPSGAVGFSSEDTMRYLTDTGVPREERYASLHWYCEHDEVFIVPGGTKLIHVSSPTGHGMKVKTEGGAEIWILKKDVLCGDKQARR